MSKLKSKKGKVASSVAILNKLQQTLPQTVIVQLYYASVQTLLLTILWYDYKGMPRILLIYKNLNPYKIKR